MPELPTRFGAGFSESSGYGSHCGSKNRRSKHVSRRQLLANYWGDGARVYHHTAPITMNYALHESLRLTLDEGLENRWARHEANHFRLKNGLAELGLGIASQEGHQLWQLNAVTVPEGTDEAGIRKALLNDHGIEIGPGLGPLAGKVWRIGLMGYSSSEENVGRVLAALKTLL